MTSTTKADDGLETSTRGLMLTSGRQDWSAHLGHVLRSPVTNILAQIEALQHGVFGTMSELQKQSLLSATASVERLMEVITDVVDLNQTAIGNLVFVDKDSSLEMLCRHGFDMVQEYAAHRAIKMTLEVSKGVTIRSDPRYFRQMIAELILAGVGGFYKAGCLNLNVTCMPEIQGVSIELNTDSGNVLEACKAGLFITEKLIELMKGDISSIVQQDHSVITTLRLPNCIRVMTQEGNLVLSSAEPLGELAG